MTGAINFRKKYLKEAPPRKKGPKDHHIGFVTQLGDDPDVSVVEAQGRAKKPEDKRFRQGRRGSGTETEVTAASSIGPVREWNFPPDYHVRDHEWDRVFALHANK